MTKPNAFRRSSGSMDFLFSMVLFLVFILCSVFTILIGSQVYSNIRARNDAAFYSDTALSYISNKVRQSDKAGCITVEEREGQEVLVLTSGTFGSSDAFDNAGSSGAFDNADSFDTDEPVYETLIYTRDGFLLELFSEQGSGLPLEAGTPVMECSGVSFQLSESTDTPLLTVTLTEKDGTEREALLSLRSSVSVKGGTKK